jgi:hypothetical protein
MLNELAALTVYLIAFVAVIRYLDFFRLQGIPRNWMLLAYLTKVIAGIALWAVYTYYYTDPAASDAFRYFQDAQLIKNQWHENRDVFWSFMLGVHMDHPEYQQLYDQLISWTSAYRYGMSNDCSTIIRLNVLIAFVSFGSFHVHALFMSFMSFVGFTAMFRSFHALFVQREKWLFIALFAIPSVVFWSSSLLKEAPLFLCLGLFLLAVMRIYHRRHRWFDYAVAAGSLVLLFYIKGYVVITMIPGLIFLALAGITGYRWLLPKWLLTHIICFLVAQQGHVFFRGGDFLYVLHKKQIDFYNIAYLRNAGSLVDIPPVTGTYDFVVHYPQAFALTYFRPYPGEAHGLADWIFIAENLLLAALIIFTLFRWNRVQRQTAAVLLMMASFVLVMAAVLGNTVPILGAMVRYKAPALPFIVMICFYFAIRRSISSDAPHPSDHYDMGENDNRNNERG